MKINLFLVLSILACLTNPSLAIVSPQPFLSDIYLCACVMMIVPKKKAYNTYICTYIKRKEFW